MGVLGLGPGASVVTGQRLLVASCYSLYSCANKNPKYLVRTVSCINTPPNQSNADLNIADNKTSHPAAKSEDDAFSASLWLRPFSHGTKIIPVGA